MDFIDQVKQLSKRVESLKDSISTEEATKTSLIMPFFSALGYDVFNPQEFVPEFTADVGIKKGEKVDYAILKDGQPVILIECKWIGENLEQHDSQLFRYFGTSSAKFGILTNGQIYRFYTDLETANKMDDKPFLEINLLDLKEPMVAELKKFSKDSFNESEVFDAASELKYTNEIKTIFAAELDSPSDDMVRLFLQTVYTGTKTQAVMERFRPIVKRALNQYVTELMNDKIKSALNSSDKPASTAAAPEAEEEAPTESATKESRIITTEEELEAYFLIKNMLKDVVAYSDITYKDNETYMAILYKNNSRKWISRLYLSDTQKIFALPDADKRPVYYHIESISDIEQYKAQFVEVLEHYGIVPAAGETV